MTTYQISARSVINAYLWNQLLAAGVLSTNDYIAPGFTNPLVPIIPIQEVPEFNNLLPGKSYIAYDYESLGYDDDWFICEETIIYKIVSADYGKLNEMLELIIDVFRRQDSSGQEVQVFSQYTDKFKFYSCGIYGYMSPGEYQGENSTMTGEVQVSYKYSRILGSNGRFA
jgi:hypothetical protein